MKKSVQDLKAGDVIRIYRGQTGRNDIFYIDQDATAGTDYRASVVGRYQDSDNPVGIQFSGFVKTSSSPYRPRAAS